MKRIGDKGIGAPVATTSTLIFVLLLFSLKTQLVVMDTLTITDVDHVRFRVTETFWELCPNVSTCTRTTDTFLARAIGSVGNTLEQIQVPCCGECNCGTHCEDDCCPDTPGLNFTLPDTSLRTDCMYAQYRPFKPMSLNGRSYLMINRCPVHATKAQYERCEMESFHYVMSEYLDHIPVTSLDTGETYINRRCATCNHEESHALVPWQLMFTCKASERSFPNTHEDIAYMARNNKECNILYRPTGARAEKCDTLIDKCNVTGEWDAYDPVTEMACNSYTSVFDSWYKNVHCYICNHGKYASVNNTCFYNHGNDLQRHGIIAILDFNSVKKTGEKPREAQSCPYQHIYDHFKNTCCLLSCSKGLSFSEDICVPMFQSIISNSNIVYVITIALQMRHHITSNNIDAGRMGTVGDILQRAESLGFSAYQIDSFIKLKVGILEVIEDMHISKRFLTVADVDYLAFQIKLSEGQVYDVNARIQQITDTFRHLNSSEFIICHRNISESQFQKSSSFFLTTGEHELNVNNISVLTPLRLPVLLRNGLLYGYDEDGRGNIPLNPIRSITVIDKGAFFVLSRDPFCPKVVLNVDEFKMSFYDDYVYFIDLGRNISRYDMSISENGDYFGICYTLYMSLVEHYVVPIPMGNNNRHNHMTILTIVCTTLSLLSLVITLSIYCILPVLRTLPGLNNMGLVTSLIFFLTLTLVNAYVDSVEPWLCRVIGMTLHLSLLSSFGWMFICTLHMTRVFARISERSVRENMFRTFLRYILFVESMSVSVVLITVVVSHVASDGRSFGYTDDPCFVDPGMLLYNVAIPIGFTVIVNIAMYLYVIVIIIRIPDIRKNSSHERNNIIIFIKLSTLTGMTWIFGFLYQFTNIDFFSYIFTVLNSGQGVFIMISFIMNKRVYEMCRTFRKSYTATSSNGSTPNSQSSRL